MQLWRSGTGGSANSPRTWVNPAPNSRNVTGKSPSSLLRSVSSPGPAGLGLKRARVGVGSCVNPEFPPGPQGGSRRCWPSATPGSGSSEQSWPNATPPSGSSRWSSVSAAPVMNPR
ncbi:uncharacterized protein LOC143695804 isoform X1 [Agelaius phoeniceus]|uniref:uncharacterized protein LOC143695804 isoform X1 n=1 Tax=Agelaius phoeniceus TaxID=39638 RepID=UPI004054C1EB